MFIEHNIFQMWISNRKGSDQKHYLTGEMNFKSGELVMENPVYREITETEFPSPVVGRYVTVIRKNDDGLPGNGADGRRADGTNYLEIMELEVFIEMPTIFLR